MGVSSKLMIRLCCTGCVVGTVSQHCINVFGASPSFFATSPVFAAFFAADFRAMRVGPDVSGETTLEPQSHNNDGNSIRVCG